MIFRFIRLLLLMLVGYALYKWLWKGENPWPFRSKKKRGTGSSQSHPAVEEMKKDPVCGTYVPINQAVKDRVDNTTYYFCSEECKLKFRELEKK